MQLFKKGIKFSLRRWFFGDTPDAAIPQGHFLSKTADEVMDVRSREQQDAALKKDRRQRELSERVQLILHRFMLTSHIDDRDAEWLREIADRTSKVDLNENGTPMEIFTASDLYPVITSMRLPAVALAIFMDVVFHGSKIKKGYRPLLTQAQEDSFISLSRDTMFSLDNVRTKPPTEESDGPSQS